MTIYSTSNNIYHELPYAFKMRVYGKDDTIVYENAPTAINKTYSELADYTGLSCVEKDARSFNVITRGAPTVSGYEVSGFTTSNYLEVPYEFSSYDGWTVVLKFKSTSASGTYSLFSSGIGSGTGVNGMDIGVASGKLNFKMTTDGSAWSTITAPSAITANTWYWIRVTFLINSFFQNSFDFSYSTDGTTWTSLGTLTPAARVYGSTTTRIGVYGNRLQNAAGNSTIDLTKCYVNLKSSGTAASWDVHWSPTVVECKELNFSNTVLPWLWQYNSSLKTDRYLENTINNSHTFYESIWPDVTFNGSNKPSFSENGTAWLSSNNQFMTKDLPDLGNVWDIYFRFITSSSVQTGGQQILWIGTGNSENTIWLKAMITNAGTSAYFCTGDGTNVILNNDGVDFQINTNTRYWIRIGSDGTRTYVYTSTTGYDNMSLLKEVQTPTSIPAKTLYIGYSTFTTKAFFKGGLDMKDLQVFKNNEEIWRGYTPTTLEGCIESLDANDTYHCYAINGDDHIKLVSSAEAITKDATNPRYLGDVTATV
jgi:hypothetical protein